MKKIDTKTCALTAIAVVSLALSGSLAYAEEPHDMSVSPQQREERAPDADNQGGNQGGPRSDKFEKRGREMFEKTDSDKDGFLSKEEMEASHRARMEEMFNKTDMDKDGKLSPEELKKGRESMRDRFRQKYKEGKGRSENGREDRPVDRPIDTPAE